MVVLVMVAERQVKCPRCVEGVHGIGSRSVHAGSELALGDNVVHHETSRSRP